MNMTSRGNELHPYNLHGESLKVPRRKGSVKGEVKVPRRRGSLEGADEHDFSRKRTTSVQPPSAVARTVSSDGAHHYSTMNGDMPVDRVLSSSRRRSYGR